MNLPSEDGAIKQNPRLASADADSQIAALRQEVQGLRLLFSVLLILLLIISGSVNIYLRRQVRMIRTQVSELGQFVGDYNKNNAPLMNDFVGRLREYSKTHQDFTPILSRYVQPTDTNIAPVIPPVTGKTKN
jgi:hypothetical protein